MVCIVSTRTALLPLVLLSVARQFAAGHSWIDCIDTNYTKIYDLSASYIFSGSEGNGFCEGYAAGYQGRGLNTIGTEYTYKILKNEVEAGAPVCENVGPNPYKDWRKRLVVPPEVDIHFAYLPNGHIVKDKKAVGTQYGIYWTKKVATLLTSTHDMIPENLVTGKTADFDDGNCGETVDIDGNPSGRAGDGKPCIGTFAIPKGTPPGIYKMVWYWEFWLDNPDAYKDPKLARGYFGAAYSSCFEVEVTSGGGNGTATSDAAEKPGPPDAPMAPEPVEDDEAGQQLPSPPPPPDPLQDDEADQPAPLPPSPPPTATPGLTPPIAAESASMGSRSEDDSTKTAETTTPVPESAPKHTPEAKTPETATPVPEPALKDTSEAATPPISTPIPEPATKDTTEEAMPGPTTLDPEPALETAETTTPVPESAPKHTPETTTPVPEPAPKDTSEAATPPTTTPIPEPATKDTTEEEMPDSTTPIPKPASKDTFVEEKDDSTSPDHEAEAPAPAADNSVEPPAAPPAEPKLSPEVPPPIPTGRGCRARVRSSVVIDW